MTQRMNVSFDERIADRVRRCGGRYKGGHSEYLAKLVERDEMREAGHALAPLYTEAFVEDALAETAAALEAEAS